MGRFLFRLPDVGEGTAEAEIVAWHVSVGQAIAEDAPLVDVMTDKATVEMTSPQSGTVLEIRGAPGEMAPVGSVIVILEVEGEGNERPGEARASAEATRAPPPAPAPAPVAPVSTAPAAPVPRTPAPEPEPSRAASASRPPRRPEGEKPLASPSVRRRAQDLGVRLNEVQGRGPGGRIEHADLDAFLAAEAGGGSATLRALPPPRPEVEEIKVIGLRRKIAEKMQEAKRRIPHFTYVEEVDMTDLETFRRHLNQVHSERGKLTVLPFMMRALVKAIAGFPGVNARFDDEAGILRRSAAVHMGIAAQTPNGLIVPVVRHAERLDLWQAGAEVARLAEAARTGKAKAEDLSGSTITLTSLGPLGGVTTTPVINYPEVAIVGPNKIIERPVAREGQIVVRKMMNLSSSFDHRVVDGYDAAAFIQAVKALLENPATLFLD